MTRNGTWAHRDIPSGQTELPGLPWANVVRKEISLQRKAEASFGGVERPTHLRADPKVAVFYGP